MREKVYIATKTAAANADEFWEQLGISLHNLRTDYIDIYQFHNPSFCPKPGDGTGLYEAMLEAKAQGKNPPHRYHEPPACRGRRGDRVRTL